ncbi:MAG: GNAT family N-acetyltransferase [Burkholderiales bacterium]|uniref:GNAT family N-acetyltransferase n=1 Tax=Nitrosomonas sp. TaxID=42353 RepID=UPI001DB568C7|nr:GNAT family N-acetyltransferase [Nitrosomonas sp.]MCB1949070.1 GNAT family N-acetyltransferase [Nitrosomonas sp.]MCP5244031.1 GNAT family N-acetyltransferase [Burkholderiales bacterium]
MIKILPLTKTDPAMISLLAREIWFRHYCDMLSNAQIHYMLAQRYCPMLIQSQLTEKNIWWKKLLFDGTAIGFSCCTRTNMPHELKIDKLYIHHDHHRKGYGKMLVDDAVKTMHQAGCNSLILTVNKQNHAAIQAYQRYGFEIIGDSVVDIGGGFFMNDYLMSMTPCV